MCGRVVVALDSESLARIGKCQVLRNNQRFNQSYNLAPGRYIPTCHQNEKREKILEFMKWGTINSNEISLINGRYENFNTFYKNWSRCLIYISGYYEWKKIASKNDGDKVLMTQPYYIKSSESDYLCLAGLFRSDSSSNDEKEVLIVTKAANDKLQHIHDRMPLILKEELFEEYLGKELKFDEFVKETEKCLTQLIFYPVGDLVNKLSNQSKDNIIHKDQITYDKNRNLKLNNFFKKSDNANNILSNVLSENKKLTDKKQINSEINDGNFIGDKKSVNIKQIENEIDHLDKSKIDKENKEKEEFKESPIKQKEQSQNYEKKDKYYNTKIISQADLSVKQNIKSPNKRKSEKSTDRSLSSKKKRVIEGGIKFNKNILKNFLNLKPTP